MEESEAGAIAGALLGDDRERPLKQNSRALCGEIGKNLHDNPIGLNPEGLYLPDDKYDTLFTRDAIQRALGGDEALPLVKYALEKAKKTFATLLLVKIVGKLWTP